MEDSFGFGGARGVEVFSDQVIWFMEKFYLLVTTEKETDNLNIVCLNAETKIIESKFTIAKYEGHKNSHQTTFLSSRVFKTYKDSQNQTIKAKLILFFTTHIQILIFTYPSHFLVTKRFVTPPPLPNNPPIGNPRQDHNPQIHTRRVRHLLVRFLVLLSQSFRPTQPDNPNLRPRTNEPHQPFGFL